MSDDYGNLIDAGASLTAGEMGAAYGAYKTYGRVQPFVQGAINAGQGAMLGADIVKVAGSGIVKRAAGQAIARAAVATGARMAVTSAATSAAAGVGAGAASGAAAGSIVPGVGTVIGAVAGAVAPFIIPHIPVVGDAVNKIPVIGGILSPDKKKDEGSHGVLGSGAFQEQAQSPHLQTPGQNVMTNRAEYLAGRGFRG